MENHKYHILIVEDDKEIRDGVEIYLKNQGYQVWKAANGKEGLEIVAQEEIHLAILDIMMPVMDGVTMLMKLREQNHEFPVIMLSAKSEEVDKIMGLNMGADDYVTKPFTPLELLARVNSHLRRYSKYLTAVSGEEQEKSHVFTIGGLELNEETVEVTVDGEAVKLTPMEFKIVQLLIKNPGRVFPRMRFMSVSGTRKRSTPIPLWYMCGTSAKNRDRSAKSQVSESGMGCRI